MKKKLVVLLAAGMMLAATAGTASAFLLDWKLDLDGAAGPKAAVNVNEYLDVVGNAWIKNTFTSATAFSFDEWGVFQAVKHDGAGNLQPGAPSHELTAILNATGTGNLSGALAFNPGGYLKFYSDSAFDYGTGTSGTTPGIFYGANNGTEIANFVVKNGSAVLDANAVPNGKVTVTFQATSIAAGYFFDNLGRDLSTYTAPFEFVMGYATTDATRLQNPVTISDLASELSAFSGFPIDVSSPAPYPGNEPPFTLLVSNNGQYRLDIATVPEPSTFMLMGLGLFGAGILARRKTNK